jgi:hypothetical protein
VQERLAHESSYYRFALLVAANPASTSWRTASDSEGLPSTRFAQRSTRRLNEGGKRSATIGVAPAPWRRAFLPVRIDNRSVICYTVNR